MQVEQLLHTVRDRALWLRSLPALTGLDDQGFLLMAEHAVTRHFATGAVIMQEGSSSEAVHLIYGGRAQMTRNGVDSGIFERTDGIGWLDLLAQNPDGGGAHALEPTTTLSIPAEVLEDLFEANFSLASNSMRLMSGFILQARGSLPAPPGHVPATPLGPPPERMLGLAERLMQARSNIIMARVNIDAVAAMALAEEPLTVAEGRPLWEVGDRADFSVRVVHGRIRCTAADGREALVQGPFQLGVMDSLSGVPRTYRAVAASPLVATRNPTTQFLTIMESHHQLARGLMRVMAMTLVEIAAARAQAQQDAA